MELKDLINIRGINVEDEIKSAISETKAELENLDTDKTCIIYTSYLYENLRKRHILAYIVDTIEDIGLSYLHRFIIVPGVNNKKYVLDLTYSQFGINPLFNKIYTCGYQLLDDAMYQKYISNISECIKKHHKR